MKLTDKEAMLPEAATATRMAPSEVWCIECARISLNLFYDIAEVICPYCNKPSVFEKHRILNFLGDGGTKKIEPSVMQANDAINDRLDQVLEIVKGRAEDGYDSAEVEKDIANIRKVITRMAMENNQQFRKVHERINNISDALLNKVESIDRRLDILENEPAGTHVQNRVDELDERITKAAEQLIGRT
jgi:hypothetical protein